MSRHNKVHKGQHDKAKKPRQTTLTTNNDRNKVYVQQKKSTDHDNK